MTKHFYIVFGAAVKPDGSPSGTLTRRVEGAWSLGKTDPNAYFLVTGGEGQYSPAEATLMQSMLLKLGVDSQRILVDDQAMDTMASAYNVARIIKQTARAPFQVTVCSSPYHNYRCQMLLYMLGITSNRGRMPSDRPALGVAKWLYYYFREMVAFPWDFLHMSFNRLNGR